MWSHLINSSRSSPPPYLGIGVTAATLFTNVAGVPVGVSLLMTLHIARVMPLRMRKQNASKRLSPAGSPGVLQGHPRVQITPSDLPESPGGKDPKDLNLLISVFGSQSPTAPGLANQFTRVIRHSLFRHQHCINGISGTADHQAHHCRSLPLFAVCHHSCVLAARRRFHLHSSSSLGA